MSVSLNNLTLAALRRLHKSYYGYKPCGMSHSELVEKLAARIFKVDSINKVTKPAKPNEFSNQPRLKEE